MPERGPVAVLDAWPIIRHYDRDEPAATQVRDLLKRPGSRPVMSAVNFAEVCYTLANKYGPDIALGRSRYLRRALRVEDADARTAQTAAWIKHAYRMSLGDTFAAATAIRHGVELWTGDGELLCSDRVWAVRDLRPPEVRSDPGPRRRTEGLADLGQAQLAAFIAAPLARAAPRR